MRLYTFEDVTLDLDAVTAIKQCSSTYAEIHLQGTVITVTPSWNDERALSAEDYEQFANRRIQELITRWTEEQ